MGRYLERLNRNLSHIIHAPTSSPEWRGAVQEVVEAAMKADTLDLLDEKGWVPEELRYTRSLEGDSENHG